MAPTCSRRSRSQPRSGAMRSTPIGSFGKRMPQSTTAIRPSASIAMQFMPISPRPPSGTMRTGGATRGESTPGPRARQRRLLEQPLRARELGEARLHPLEALAERGARDLVALALEDGRDLVPGQGLVHAQHEQGALLGRERRAEAVERGVLVL